MLEVEPPAEDITLETMERCSTPTSVDHDDQFGVPTLEELGNDAKLRPVGSTSEWALHFCLVSVVAVGFETKGHAAAVWPGGETEGLARLKLLEEKVSVVIRTGFDHFGVV